MEVALVLDRFDPRHGGLENWASQYAFWLQLQGHRVHIVAAECARDIDAQSLVLHSLGVSRPREAFASAAEAHLRRLRPDIVHDLGSGWYFDVLQPQFGSRLADARQNLLTYPLFERWRLHFSRSRKRRLRDIREFEHRQYTAPGGRIVAVSAMTRTDLQSLNRVTPARIDLVPNGVSPDTFAPIDPATRFLLRQKLGLDPGSDVFLFAAHNFRLKGLSTLLYALRLLRTKSLHGLIVGRGDVAKYENLARRLRVQDQMTFCGFVEDIRDYYKAADFLVHPTFYDPCSLSVLEALACGLPVITTRANGAAELMEDGGEGFVLDDPANATTLATAIRLLLDRTTRARMAREARAAALGHTAEKSFGRLLEIYHDVQARGQGRDSHAWK